MATITALERPLRPGATPRRPASAKHLLLVRPREAQEWLEDTPLPHQRPLSLRHVAVLVQLIRRGHFRQGSDIAFAVLPRGKEGGRPGRYLVNGQHTLAAMAQGRHPVWLWVEERQVADLAEAVQLYATFDKNRVRTWDHIYRVSPHPELQDLGATQRNALGAAVALLGSGFQLPHAFQEMAPWSALLRDSTVRLALMVSWAPEMHNFLNGCHAPRHSRQIQGLLQRAAVLAVALVTYRHQPERAHRFWPRVAADSGLVQGQPAHTLLRWLRENPTRPILPLHYPRYVAQAWNAEFANTALTHLTAPKVVGPIRLAGTPLTGTIPRHYLSSLGEALQEPQPWEDEGDR